ncbi:MAG TPA: MBOAT family O-acyltransferase [Bacteroidia bacterium]|nr:MBOAT family O-acyltransferase [Bacteroidia bacterium]
MLPFADIDFFILFGIFAGLGLIIRLFLPKLIALKHYLLLITLVYIIFFFPKPIQAFAFVAYCYLIYFLFNYVFKISNKLWGSLLLALPMILIKASVKDMNMISFAGLSYVTFRVIQIYFDNDRERSPKPVAILDFLLFMLFPPTILIGPIDRFNRFKGDTDEGFTRITGTQITTALNDLSLGVAQKFIFAEFVSRFWLSKINADSHHIGDMANMMYAYSVYLYFDFAGYSNMAMGLGKLLGIDVPFNFNSPYLSINPQDFWRRWHASLGDWLRDYIFRPYYKWISGKKKLKLYPVFRQNSGLFLTFTIMGFWNGFSANFIISGVIFGVYSMVHNTYVITCNKKGRDVLFGSLNPTVVRVISIFIMFNFACFALYVFSGKLPFLH